MRKPSYLCSRKECYIHLVAWTITHAAYFSFTQITLNGNRSVLFSKWKSTDSSISSSFQKEIPINSQRSVTKEEVRIGLLN